MLDLRDGDDVRDPATVERALDGVDAVCHQAAMVGLGVDLDDIAEYVGHNDMGTAVLLRAIGRPGRSGRIVLASSMVVYGEGRYRCEVHGVVAPGPRRIADLEAGRYEPPCPTAAQALAPEAVGEDAPTDPRNVYAATKLHQEHLASAFARETAHTRHGAAVPQRLRAADAARHALRGRGGDLRVRARGGPGAPGPRGRRAAAATSSTCATSRARTCSRSPAQEPYAGPLNVCSGRRRSIADMAGRCTPRRGPARPAPEIAGGYRLGDVRHVFADPARAERELGFAAREDFDAGMAELAEAMA